MPFIHVCSLARVEDAVTEIGARSIVTLLRDGTRMIRPPAIEIERHLYIAVSDVIAPADGEIHPASEHIQRLLDFVRGWDQAEPLLIHCFAGVSRSTAAAFISACALNPSRAEADIAQAIRAASPTATPNSRLVALADDMLQRNGRMARAIDGIGRGELCEEGVPFSLKIR